MLILKYLFLIFFHMNFVFCWNLNLNISKYKNYHTKINNLTSNFSTLKINRINDQATIILNKNQNLINFKVTAGNNSYSDEILNNLRKYCDEESLLKNEKCLQNVYKLDMRNNLIDKIPNSLLNSFLNNLKEIDFSNNYITNFSSPNELFFKIPQNKIESINLSNNKLNLIQDEMFKHLKSLRYLNLSKNQIKYISLFAFSVDSQNLIELDLSYNMITDSSLEFLLFSNLVNLKYLNMNHNRLTYLSSHFLYNLYSLEHISLKFNNLMNFDLFHIINKNNEFLKIIDLSYNLNLKFNEINNIQNLETNESYSNEKESNLNNVEELNLSGIDLSSLNFNKFLNNLFDNYRNLKTLNLSSTKIKSVIWSSKWPISIQVIDLSNNNLKDSQFDCSQFDSTKKSLHLKLIDLSNNRFKNFAQFLNSCSNILSSNYQKTNELTIDLRNNIFESLSHLSTKKNSDPTNICKSESYKSIVLLKGNPLVCDCDENSWWSSVYSTHDSLFFLNLKKKSCILIKDYEDLSCSSISSAQVQNLITFNLKPAYLVKSDDMWKISNFKPIRYDIIAPELFCPYKFTCSSNKCECCGFRACDCASICPSNCRCVRDFRNIFDIIDCTSSNLSTIPNFLSTTTTEIRLNKNNLKRVHPFQFFSKFRLNSIDLSENQLGFIEENSFHGLNQLKILKLSSNNLQILLGYEFKDLINIEELYLDNNHIQFISNSTFTNLFNLRILNLLNNNLRHLLDSKIYFQFNVNLNILKLDKSLNDIDSYNYLSLSSLSNENVILPNKKQNNMSKKYDDRLYINLIKSYLNLKKMSNNYETFIKCIFNKFKISAQFEVRNNRTFRNSLGLSKTVNFEDVDPNVLKLYLIDKFSKFKLICQDNIYVNLSSLESESNFESAKQTSEILRINQSLLNDNINKDSQNKPLIVLSLNSLLFIFILILFLIAFFITLSAFLFAKYQNSKIQSNLRSSTSCFKNMRNLLNSIQKKIFKIIPVNEYNRSIELTENTNKPSNLVNDIFIIYNRLDSHLVNKLISPILRSKPYNFKLILQHEKIKPISKQNSLLTKYSNKSLFVMFVLSKNLLSDVEYDLANKLNRNKKLVILADELSESLAEKLIQPGKILKAEFNLENMSFNFTSINIYDDCDDSHDVSDRDLLENVNESFLYTNQNRINLNLATNLDLHCKQIYEF